MHKNLRNFLVAALLISQGACAGSNDFTLGAELATAALRAPVVILAKKAESDHKFKKAALLGATADFVRMTNDIFALYNLHQKNDQNLYNWTKCMWIGQDFTALLIKIKKMATGTVRLPEANSKEEQKIDLMLSDFLKKLDIYFLPSLEGVAAVLLSLEGAKIGQGPQDFYILPSPEGGLLLSEQQGRIHHGRQSGSFTLPLQAIISGSRLLSEMLEAKSGSLEQKLVIACTVIHAALLLADFMKPKKHEGPNEGEAGQEMTTFLTGDVLATPADVAASAEDASVASADESDSEEAQEESGDVTRVPHLDLDTDLSEQAEAPAANAAPAAVISAKQKEAEEHGEVSEDDSDGTSFASESPRLEDEEAQAELSPAAASVAEADQLDSGYNAGDEAPVVGHAIAAAVDDAESDTGSVVVNSPGTALRKERRLSVLPDSPSSAPASILRKEDHSMGDALRDNGNENESGDEGYSTASETPAESIK